MTIPAYELDPERVERDRRLFPDEIELDDWIMFHGTSAYNAEAIEREGFDAARGAVSAAEIERVTRLYEAMKWHGADGGGYAVLKPFSLMHDFNDSERSILYFAETSMRALLYARRDFAGGEKLRALRRAIADLDAYLADPDLREQHRSASQIWESVPGFDEAPPVEVDAIWLRQQMRSLADIRRIADEAFQQHHQGVVYALRMSPEDVDQMHYHGAMGIETSARIPPSKVVAKALVPRGYETTQPGRMGDEVLDRFERGLIGALTGRHKAPR